MLERLIALLKSLGILTEDKVESVTAELKKLDLDKPPVKPPVTEKKPSAEDDARIAALEQQIKTLTDALAAEADARKKATEQTQAQLKTQQEKTVADLVADALKTGKIAEAKKEWLTKMAQLDIAEATSWVKDAPVMAGFKAPATGDGKDKSGGKQDDSAPRITAGKPAMVNKILEFNQAANS